MANNIKIYKGTSLTNANLISGVDLDSFTITRKLDESFDIGMFNIVSTSSINLKSRDIISIVEYEDTTRKTPLNECQYVVDTIGKSVIKKTSTETLYEYQVSFYEKTVELQNILCPNTESTQPLPALWKDISSEEYEEYTTLNGKPNTMQKVFKIYEMGAYDSNQNPVSSLTWRCGYELSALGSVEVSLPLYRRRINTKMYTGAWSYIPGNWVYNYHYEIYQNGVSIANGNWADNPSYTFTQTGIYDLRIYYYGEAIFNIHSDDWKDTEIFINTSISILPNGETAEREITDKYHSIYDVLQKLIWTLKPYKTTNGVPTNPKYSLGTDLNWLKNELCPDIYFTGNDLYTNLILIGRTCNSIPYVDDNNVIHFINLGDRTEVPNAVKTAFNRDIRISDYDRCGAVISDLQNMIPTNKIGNATCEDSWRSLETEVGTQFTADSCFYRSDFPMYQLKDVRIRYWNGSNVYQGERSILKYMFESSVYGTLDSTSPTASNSIINSLKWTQYSNKIEGFVATTTEWTITGMHPTSICKILSRAFGISIDSGLIENWNKRIMMKAIYIPVISARVKQYRHKALDFGENEMQLNQQTNLGALEEVGNSMKHSLLQTGNDSVQRNIFVSSWSDIPTINQEMTIDGEIYKVSQVVRSYSRTGYDVAITFTKNFNRISAYQSLATEKRWADVPLDNAITRTIQLDDYCYIGNITGKTEVQETDRLLITSTSTPGYRSAINLITRMVGFLFMRGSDIRNRPRYLAFRLKDADGTTYPNTKTCVADGITDDSWVILPLTSGAFGNSIFLKASTLDNYSAGHCLVDRGSYKYTIDIPYANELGEGLLLDVKYVCSDWDPSTFNKNSCIISNTALESLESALVASNIYLNKGSREQLEFVYQMHYIACDNNIVVGKGLSELSPFIVDKNILTEKQTVKMVVVDHHITEQEFSVENTNPTIPPFELEYCRAAGSEYSDFWIQCDEPDVEEGEATIETFGDLHMPSKYSLCLVSEYEQVFYDDRPPQKKRELLVGLNMDSSYNSTAIENFTPFTFHFRGNFMK